MYKSERVIAGPQQAEVTVANGEPVLNLCANNYLGLANHPAIVGAARDALDNWGYGLASVRFICGTQSIHKQLEEKLSGFLGMDDTILYGSCFDANGGLFETLLDAEDAVISDELNHASIIDGIRLCKATKYRYAMVTWRILEAKLKEAQRSAPSADRNRWRLFDGWLHREAAADLRSRGEVRRAGDGGRFARCWVCGSKGAGRRSICGVEGRIDILTGTLGKALGGASGGYTSGRKEIIQLLRQRSRPYLFSNSVAPPIVAASLKVLELVSESDELRDHLRANTLVLPREQ